MAEDEKTTLSRPLEAIVVPVIGTGDGSKLKTGTEAVTPEPHAPNVVLQVITPIAAVAIRFANTFLTVLLGLVLGAMTTDVIPAADFFELVVKCAGLSIAGAGVGLIKDLITIFGQLEKRYPLATGNV